MITNIQALRAYAAIMIVVYHTNFKLPWIAHTDFQAVAIFFVISGFIMTYIILKDDRESTPGSFFLHRIIRIVPLYWFCTLLLIVLANLGGFNVPVVGPRVIDMIQNRPAEIVAWLGSAFQLSGWTSADAVVKSLLFIPHTNTSGGLFPVLGVGWTLNLEMYFYACFAGMLFFGKRRAPFLTLGAVLLACVVAPLLLRWGILSKIYPVNYIFYFAAGIGVFYAWRAIECHALPRRIPRQAVFGALALGLAVYGLMNFYPSLLPAGAQFFTWIGPVTIVLGALILHSSGVRLSSGFVIFLGATSYSLYLTHTLVLEFLRPFGRIHPLLDFQESPVGCGLAVGMSVMFGALVHLLVEKPSLACFRKKRFPGPAVAAAPSVS